MSAQDSLFMRKLSNFDDGSTFYNDVWGYASGGREYAIIGTRTEIKIIDITIPQSPVEVFSTAPGQNSIWRDFKTFGHYLYGVSEKPEGLVIIDMSTLPASAAKVNQTNVAFNEAHNIFIDEPNGKLYAVGSSDVPNSVVVIDLLPSPEHIVSANVDTMNIGSYTHDIYVKNNIGYCSNGMNGYEIYDFSDPDNFLLLSSYPAGGKYNHSSWTTDNDQYAVYAVEFGSSFLPLTILDISVPGTISFVSEWHDPLLAPAHTNNVPHNPFIVGNMVVCSYYEDGVQVVDIANPANPFRLAYYDMVPNNFYSGTNGVWGVYPFLPSGNILATDDASGLWVLEIDFSIVVPVNYNYFRAKKSSERPVVIEWQTASEINSSHFEIEHSRDGKVFTKLSQIESKGSRTSPKDYGYIHKTPNNGTNYYRLKQYDQNGNFEFSEIRTVEINPAFSGIRVFPMPALNNYFNVEIARADPGEYSVDLYSLTGQLLYTSSFTNSFENEYLLKKIDFGNDLGTEILYLTVTKDEKILYSKRVVL